MLIIAGSIHRKVTDEVRVRARVAMLNSYLPFFNFFSMTALLQLGVNIGKSKLISCKRYGEKCSGIHSVLNGGKLSACSCVAILFNLD